MCEEGRVGQAGLSGEWEEQGKRRKINWRWRGGVEPEGARMRVEFEE